MPSRLISLEGIFVGENKVGFSLKYFLNELQDILNDPFLSRTEQLNLIRECVEFNTQYAKECGQIDAD